MNVILESVNNLNNKKMPTPNLSALENLTEAQVHAISHELLQRVISKKGDNIGAVHDSHSSSHGKNSAVMDARH